MSDPPELRTLKTGIALGECPRWHDGRLWFSDWVAQEIVAVDLAGHSEIVARMSSWPFSFDWLPDGRMVVISARDGLLLAMEPDGSLVTHVDLSSRADPPWNEIVVDHRGNAYVNNIGFSFPGGEFAPGTVVLITPDRAARTVAHGMAFPNGMAITPDGSTLIVGESYGNRLTAFEIASDGTLSEPRLWADVGNGAPDGICIDADGAVWYGDVPNRCCVRVSEGGEVQQSIELDRGCFACMLGGEEGRTLFMLTAEWGGTDQMASGARTGQLVATTAPAPHAGWP